MSSNYLNPAHTYKKESPPQGTRQEAATISKTKKWVRHYSRLEIQIICDIYVIMKGLVRLMDEW